MNKTSKTCVLLIIFHLTSTLATQELDKRVPQGFLGMRGKKDLDDIEHYYKRKPQFFVGVKGKKNLFDIPDYPQRLEEKRVPLGFVGMRGKKADDDMLKEEGSLIGKIDYTARPYGMPSKLSFLEEMLTQYLQKMNVPKSQETTTEDETLENVDNSFIYKRAPKMQQFYGMRGKKSIQKKPFDLSFRGKFIGVRGKKNMASGDDIKYMVSQYAPPSKKKGPMSFLSSTNGKKFMYDDLSEEGTVEY